MTCAKCGSQDILTIPNSIMTYYWCHRCSNYTSLADEKSQKGNDPPVEEKLDYTQRQPRGGWF